TRAQSSPTMIELMLSDIRVILTELAVSPLPLFVPGGKFIMDRDRIRSADLARLLGELEGRPWQEWGRSGQPITQHALARLLAEANVRPSTHAFHTATQNGSPSLIRDKG